MMGAESLGAGEPARDLGLLAGRRVEEGRLVPAPPPGNLGQSPKPPPPAIFPNTTVSRSELPPSRLAPWTLTQAHSPAA